MRIKNWMYLGLLLAIGWTSVAHAKMNVVASTSENPVTSLRPTGLLH